MPDLAPFRGIHYDPDRFGVDVSVVAAPPYDVIDEERRAHLRAQDEFNVVHLTLPDGRDPAAYRAAGDLFATWLADGVLVADPEPRFYIYRVSFVDEDGRTRDMTGVIGLLALEPPGAGSVLPHERTMPKPTGDRLELLRATRANLEPIWGLSLAGGLSSLLEPENPPIATSTDTRGARHRLHAVASGPLLDAIAAAVGSAPIVIADGHHRYETSLHYQDERRAAGDASAGHDRIMTMIVELADNQLAVRPIHRLLSGLDVHALRAAVERYFTLQPVGRNEPDTVAGLGETMASAGAMALVDGEAVALLSPRSHEIEKLLAQEPGVVRHVDAAVFEVAIAPLVEAAGGQITYRHDRMRVADQVRKGQVDGAVLLRPVNVATIRQVAEQGERMPQKTTFFHPKPTTGLVFRSLDQ